MNIITKDKLIGNWRSYKVVWGGITIGQGEDNYTILRFLEDNRLITEIKVEKKEFIDDNESYWDIENREKPYIILDGIPHYEVVGFEKDHLILKPQSGIIWYFKPEIN